MKTPPSTTMPIIQQRSLTIYTFLGAVQSALWFFVLPYITKPYWTNIFDNYTNQQAEILLWAIGAPYMVLYILVAALPPYYILRDVKFIQQYKISKDPWPWLSGNESNSDKNDDDAESIKRRQEAFWEQTYKSIILDFLGLFLFIPILVYIKTIVFPALEMSFSMEEFPTPSIQSATTLFSMGVIHEFGFYWTHRLIHMYPSLYKYHKVHHEYKQNNVLSAQHFHPIDFFLSIALPAIMTTIIVRPRHGFTQFQFGLWLLTANFDDHLGYAFPWAVVRWFPWSAGTDAHEFHHSVNMGCYGSKLCLWDWLFGTDVVYNEWRKKRWGLVSAKD